MFGPLCVCVQEIDLLSSGEGTPTPSQACCSNTDVGCIIHIFLGESQTKTSSTLPRYGVGFANTSETIKNCRVLRDPMPRGELRMHQERSKEVSRSKTQQEKTQLGQNEVGQESQFARMPLTLINAILDGRKMDKPWCLTEAGAETTLQTGTTGSSYMVLRRRGGPRYVT